MMLNQNRTELEKWGQFCLDKKKKCWDWFTGVEIGNSTHVIKQIFSIKMT